MKVTRLTASAILLLRVVFVTVVVLVLQGYRRDRGRRPCNAVEYAQDLVEEDAPFALAELVCYVAQLGVLRRKMFVGSRTSQDYFKFN